jgi:hypothetical protein
MLVSSVMERVRLGEPEGNLGRQRAAANAK